MNRDDAIMDRWQAGATERDIQNEFDVDRHDVNHIVGRARKNGDPRAVYHGPRVGSVSEADAALLRTLWDSSMSAAMIGQRMGITKNAVLGRVHRAGLPPRRASPDKPNKGNLTNRLRRVRARSAGHGDGGPSMVPYRTPPRRLPLLPMPDAAMAVRFEVVQSGQCLFIPGDSKLGPDSLCCGSPVKEGRPYCGFHAALCYVPLPERSDRRTMRLVEGA